MKKKPIPLRFFYWIYVLFFFHKIGLHRSVTEQQSNCSCCYACVRLVLWLVPGRLVLAGSALTPQPPAAAEQPQPPAAEQGDSNYGLLKLTYDIALYVSYICSCIYNFMKLMN